jgi:hypothetical protein
VEGIEQVLVTFVLTMKQHSMEQMLPVAIPDRFVGDLFRMPSQHFVLTLLYISFHWCAVGPVPVLTWTNLSPICINIQSCLAGSNWIFPTISSISAMISGVIFSTTLTASQFSTTCSGREAPVITAETFGFFKHQASESWAWLTPNFLAIGF